MRQNGLPLRAHWPAMMRHHRADKGFDCSTPVHDLIHRHVKWMLRPAAQPKERPAFGEMSARRAAPQAGRPAFRLKPRMQLANVMQEHQRGKARAVGSGQWRPRRNLQPRADHRQLDEPMEHCCHVHRMMCKRVNRPVCTVGLAPRLKSHSSSPIRFWGQNALI